MSILVTTANELAGYRVVREFGVVRGVTVRSRSALGNCVAGWKSWFGGRIGAYIHLAYGTAVQAQPL